MCDAFGIPRLVVKAVISRVNLCKLAIGIGCMTNTQIEIFVFDWSVKVECICYSFFFFLLLVLFVLCFRKTFSRESSFSRLKDKQRNATLHTTEKIGLPAITIVVVFVFKWPATAQN